MYDKETVKTMDIYRVTKDFLERKVSGPQFEEWYIKASRDARDLRTWENFEEYYYAEHKMDRTNPEVDVQIIEIISTLFGSIFVSVDAYCSILECFDPKDPININEAQLYAEVKEKFDRINRLLEEIA